MTLGGKLTVVYGVGFLLVAGVDELLGPRSEASHAAFQFVLGVMALPLGLVANIVVNLFTDSRETLLYGVLVSMVPNSFLWGYGTEALIKRLRSMKNHNDSNSERSDEDNGEEPRRSVRHHET